MFKILYTNLKSWPTGGWSFFKAFLSGVVWSLCGCENFWRWLLSFTLHFTYLESWTLLKRCLQNKWLPPLWSWKVFILPDARRTLLYIRTQLSTGKETCTPTYMSELGPVRGGIWKRAAPPSRLQTHTVFLFFITHILWGDAEDGLWWLYSIGIFFCPL